MKKLATFYFLAILVFIADTAFSADNIYNKASDEVAGITSLMSAVASDDFNGVNFFVKANKDIINKKNLGGATALHIACRQKNSQIARFLIENGADVNVVDREGWTPLMRSSLAGDIEIVGLLLDHGADARNINSIGESAIIHATTSNCDECLSLILMKYDFINLMQISLLKNQLSSAFIIATNHNNEVAKKMLESYLDSVVKTIAERKRIAEEKMREEQIAAAKELENKTFVVISEKDPKNNSEIEEVIIEISQEQNTQQPEKSFKMLVGEQPKILKDKKNIQKEKIKTEEKAIITEEEKPALAPDHKFKFESAKEPEKKALIETEEVEISIAEEKPAIKQKPQKFKLNSGKKWQKSEKIKPVKEEVITEEKTVEMNVENIPQEETTTEEIAEVSLNDGEEIVEETKNVSPVSESGIDETAEVPTIYLTDESISKETIKPTFKFNKGAAAKPVKPLSKKAKEAASDKVFTLKEGVK